MIKPAAREPETSHMTSVAAYAAHWRREARPRPALELAGKRSRPVVAATRWLTIVGLSAYSAHSLLGAGGHSVDALFETWVFNALLCAAVALCLLRALCSPRERIAWTVLGAGLGCWALGEIVFTVDPGQVTAASFPSTSDVLWLTFYPASFIALGILVRARTRHFYPSLWLDGAIGALALAALACEFILPPMVGYRKIDNPRRLGRTPSTPRVAERSDGVLDDGNLV